MDIMVWTYAAYLVLSIGLTVFVARTLHKNGRIFLVDSFGGNEKLADSVNHLLVVGFYTAIEGIRRLFEPPEVPATELLVFGIVGLVVDSVIFLYLAFGSLDFLAGQVVGKAWMVLLAIPLVSWLRRRDERLGLSPA